MKNILLDILFPKRCVNCRKFGGFLCADCFAKISFTTNFSCPVCLAPAINGMTHPFCKKKYSLDGVIPTLLYKGVVKKLLYQLKYAPYLASLGPILSDILFEGIIQNESLFPLLQKNPIIAPVPLHPNRERFRGYNHAGIIAQNLAKKLDAVYVKDILKRIKDTKPQYKLSKEDRKKNILGALKVAEKFENKLNGKTIILIDDITTTFATLQECAKVLKKSGAVTVVGITVAKEA
ncbi:MAG: hypothetical protein COX79_05465 [Candidatus Levybacteria bacterium CG_4_10_14_0_2_um_filter_36_16]|nr:MAG: hypothetical protein AUK12_04660 [Candidatus Levybacteria bacterium CG2_30_37_29]PIZ96337.1 MAG: hypothetical protein COX79_05465 [Candidatus Levybacteria bacterium CG_4_10_14_0_2_um_filter_36_16]